MRFAVIGDIHGNIYALEAVYEDIKNKNIDFVISTGDLVGYMMYPNEVIEFLKKNKIASIQGNHDKFIAKGNKIQDISVFSQDEVQKNASEIYTNYVLKDENRGMYFSTNIEDAKQYALGLDDCGNHNEESFIYSIEIPENANIVVMDDWMDFDAMGYVNYENTPEFATAEEMEGYFFVKNPDNFDFVLVENFKNVF